MTNATAMTDTWGFNQIGSNLFNGSISAWKNAGGAADGSTGKVGLALYFSWGLVPFMIFLIVYVRTKKPIPSIFSLGLSTAVLQTFGLMPSLLAGAIYLITGIALAVFFMGWLKNR